MKQLFCKFMRHLLYPYRVARHELWLIWHYRVLMSFLGHCYYDVCPRPATRRVVVDSRKYPGGYKIVNICETDERNGWHHMPELVYRRSLFKKFFGIEAIFDRRVKKYWLRMKLRTAYGTCFYTGIFGRCGRIADGKQGRVCKRHLEKYQGDVWVRFLINHSAFVDEAERIARRAGVYGFTDIQTEIYRTLRKIRRRIARALGWLP